MDSFVISVSTYGNSVAAKLDGTGWKTALYDVLKTMESMITHIWEPNISLIRSNPKFFKVMKHKLKDNDVDAKQNKHDSPINSLLRMYEKYALAIAMQVVIPSKIISPSVFSMPDAGLESICSRSPRIVTNPCATIPNNGGGAPKTDE